MAKSPSLVGGPAAALAASSFKDSFKASFRVRYPHIERCCFISRSRTLSMKVLGPLIKGDRKHKVSGSQVLHGCVELRQRLAASLVLSCDR